MKSKLTLISFNSKLVRLKFEKTKVKDIEVKEFQFQTGTIKIRWINIRKYIIHQ